MRSISHYIVIWSDQFQRLAHEKHPQNIFAIFQLL